MIGSQGEDRRGQWGWGHSGRTVGSTEGGECVCGNECESKMKNVCVCVCVAVFSGFSLMKGRERVCEMTEG